MATKWTLDPAHSEVTFKVKHMMITSVTGNFGKFNITAESETDDFSKAAIVFTADVNSINTNSADRDKHLKSADFFDVEKYPEITFTSNGIGDGKCTDKITGDLTIHGVTKSVTLNIELVGIAKDPWGNTKAGFSVTGSINRKDFGLNWNAALEAGGILVGEEVKISAEIQLVKQA